MRRRSLLIFLSVLATGLAFAANAVAAERLPVIYNGLLGYSQPSPSASPPGANDWSCHPSAEHPRPVILVHGTFADMSDSWQALSPLLRNHGYCVFALNYGASAGSAALGVYGTGEIARSAQQLSSFVDRVLAATGARRVDLVGHSQGGMMPRYYLKYLGGGSRVRTLVGLAPSNHGTDLNGLFTLGSFLPGAEAFLGLCEACEEQAQGSPFMTELNAGGDTVPGIRYTVIESQYDEVVTPYSSAFLAAGPQVTNILLQSQCPADRGEHLSMPYDQIADADVLNSLDPAHSAAIRCVAVAPIVGG